MYKYNIVIYMYIIVKIIKTVKLYVYSLHNKRWTWTITSCRSGKTKQRKREGEKWEKGGWDLGRVTSTPVRAVCRSQFQTYHSEWNFLDD